MELVRLVIPELLQQDFLHHYHTSLKAATKGKAERTNESGLTCIGEESIGVYSVTWENVLIARREKENLFFAANFRGLVKPLTRFKKSR